MVDATSVPTLRFILLYMLVNNSAKAIFDDESNMTS